MSGGEIQSTVACLCEANATDLPTPDNKNEAELNYLLEKKTR